MQASIVLERNQVRISIQKGSGRAGGTVKNGDRLGQQTRELEIFVLNVQNLGQASLTKSKSISGNASTVRRDMRSSMNWI
ncbi:hypothetical protein KSC_092890 [Ktedonobacter sp. SOSP1-52]|nr:hypothetical protein KSC_092890 [Ktedonobacter sp. SOSP1-52]